jgi:hypothetical protein
VDGGTEERIRGWQAAAIFAACFKQHPELRYLAPSCTSEVVIGEEGTTIRLDVAVPSDLLDRPICWRVCALARSAKSGA